MRLFTRSVFIVLFQGSLSIFFDQDWKLPRTIDALNGSCVDIPCTYTPPKNLEAPSVAWYLLHFKYVHIFNSRASSLVRKDYENRTSLVPGNNSCTLRIDPVRKEDKTNYYPGIAENPATNAFSQGFRFVWLDVKESPEPPTMTIPKGMTEGTPTNVTCSANHTCGSSPPTITWNKPGQIVRRSEDLLGGYWREKSELIYNPSHEDDGTTIRCTIKYHNGHTLEREAKLDIRYAAVGVEVIKSRTSGGAIELRCVFLSGRPAVTHYTWIKDGLELKEVRRTLLFDSHNYNSGAYTCIAHNVIGSSASVEVYVTDYTLKEHTEKIVYVTLLAIFGFICLTSLTMTIYLCRRLKLHQATRRPKSQLPDAIYSVLEKTDISNEYDTLKPASRAQPGAKGTDSILMTKI